MLITGITQTSNERFTVTLESRDYSAPDAEAFDKIAFRTKAGTECASAYNENTDTEFEGECKPGSDTEFAFETEKRIEIKTTLGVLTDLRLCTGKELDGEQLAEFRLRSSRSLTLEKAVEMISRRAYSCKELRDKLISKGVDPETAEWCPAKLTDMGLMDDARYAASIVRHYANRGYGAQRIKGEFYHRGIDRELWEDALAQLKEPETEDSGGYGLASSSATKAEAAADKVLHARLKDPTDKDQVRKAVAALQRRGFSWDEIRGALKRMEAELDELDSAVD